MEHRKTILRKLPSPLAIVTSSKDGEATGAVITFMTQTSMEPPLVTMAIRPDSELYAFLQSSGKGVIHFPAKDQTVLIASFFKIKERTESSLNGYHFKVKDEFVHLDDISMYLEIVVEAIIEKGDHHLFVCQVVSTGLDNDYSTLNLSDTNWKYGG